MPKKPWILANNPNKDNMCSCFKKSVPDPSWVVVKRYAKQEECLQEADACSELFMKTPIKDPSQMGMS
jgi:hypothetical protein